MASVQFSHIVVQCRSFAKNYNYTFCHKRAILLRDILEKLRTYFMDGPLYTRRAPSARKWRPENRAHAPIGALAKFLGKSLYHITKLLVARQEEMVARATGNVKP